MGKFLRFVFGPGCAQNSRIRDISAIRLFWAHPGPKMNLKNLIVFFSWLCWLLPYGFVGGPPNGRAAVGCVWSAARAPACF